MESYPLGGTDTGLTTTRLAYGCMGIRGKWNARDETLPRRAVLAAFEAGFRTFDHADIYGKGECEAAFGEILRDVAGMRDEITLISKCGHRFPWEPGDTFPHHYDFSASHLRRSVEGSLQRLGVETLDVLLLHRPDVLMDPDEVAAVLTEIREAGKVREFGVSNFTPSQMQALQSRLPFPLIINQIELHPGAWQAFEDGTLDHCLTHRITPMAWSPLGKGRYAAGGEPETEQDAAIVTALDTLGDAHGVSRTVITLAYLLRHPAGVIPVIGTTRPERMQEAVQALKLTLNRKEWYQVHVAARGAKMP